MSTLEHRQFLQIVDKLRNLSFVVTTLTNAWFRVGTIDPIHWTILQNTIQYDSQKSHTIHLAFGQQTVLFQFVDTDAWHSRILFTRNKHCNDADFQQRFLLAKLVAGTAVSRCQNKNKAHTVAIKSVIRATCPRQSVVPRPYNLSPYTTVAVRICSQNKTKHNSHVTRQFERIHRPIGRFSRYNVQMAADKRHHLCDATSMVSVNWKSQKSKTKKIWISCLQHRNRITINENATNKI